MNMALSQPFLTEGVMAKRVVAWLIDAGVIALLLLLGAVFWGVFGLLTLGLGWHMLALLPLVPFFYHFVTLAQFGRTPGQALVGLCVRRVSDLGPVDLTQALVNTIGFYLTMATSGILFLVALVTEGNRTLHDMVAGVVVVRAERVPGSLSP